MASVPYEILAEAALILNTGIREMQGIAWRECRGCLITVVLHLLNLFLKPV